MKNILLILLITILSSTTVWSDKLYSNTYMQEYKITNQIIDTEISDGVTAKKLADGKYRKIMRFEPIFFNGKELKREIAFYLCRSPGEIH